MTLANCIEWSNISRETILLIGFRLRKVYGPLRVFMSAALNWMVRWMFGTAFRDVNCGLKLVRRDVLEDIQLTCNSPFIGVELMVRAVLQGYRVGEVGISTYEREFGDSAAISLRNITATFRDLVRVRREVFRNRPRSSLCPNNSKAPLVGR